MFEALNYWNFKFGNYRVKLQNFKLLEIEFELSRHQFYM